MDFLCDAACFTISSLTFLFLKTAVDWQLPSILNARFYCFKTNMTTVEEVGLHAYEPMLGGPFTCLLTQLLSNNDVGRG